MMHDGRPLRYSVVVPSILTSVVPAYAQAWPLGNLTAANLLQLQCAFPQKYPALLQSAAASSVNQYDVLMAFPQQRLTLLTNDRLQLPDAMQSKKDMTFLDALDHWWSDERVSAQSFSLPFCGGWFVYLGYELAAQIEPALQAAFNNIDQDENAIVAQAVRIPAAIVRDAVTNDAWFVAEHEFSEKLPRVQSDLDEVRMSSRSLSQTILVKDLHEEPPQDFLQAVEQALSHIAAGDIYQANLSREWSATLVDHCSAQDVYEKLCSANPAPFAGIALLNDDEAVISSSPERLIRINNGNVTTRPIAGTRPRSSDTLRDAQLIDELRQNSKEQAEHVMLLDLERNDLGRISKAGSVHVDEFMTVESYAHVHHIVSNVRGELSDTVSPGQAIAAVFPGGTITGCPKVRCMQVIAEVENVCRGAYTGAMGYINRDGSMDLNILIRTLSLHGRSLTFRAGAGIVADSMPERELEETRAKALGLLRALGAPC